MTGEEGGTDGQKQKKKEKVASVRSGTGQTLAVNPFGVGGSVGGGGVVVVATGIKFKN